MLNVWSDTAGFRGVSLKTFGAAIFLNQQHIKGIFPALVFGTVHPRTANGHAGHREAQRNGTLFQQSADIGCGNVTLDDITADRGCVARAQLLGHAQSLTRSGIAHIAHIDLETMGLQMFDPQLAATTVGVFPDLDRGHLREHGFLQERARYKR